MDTPAGDEKIFVQHLLKKLQTESTSVKAVKRIEMSETDEPPKIELTSEKDKVTLLQNLNKLKGDDHLRV